MNRIFASLFAAVVGVVHVLVLAGLIVAAVAIFTDLPQLSVVRSEVQQTAGQVPASVALIATFIGYVLLMGLVSTLVSINSNLERLASSVDKSLSDPA